LWRHIGEKSWQRVKALVVGVHFPFGCQFRSS
jgi:hypothetical protein